MIEKVINVGAVPNRCFYAQFQGFWEAALPNAEPPTASANGNDCEDVSQPEKTRPLFFEFFAHWITSLNLDDVILHALIPSFGIPRSSHPLDVKMAGLDVGDRHIDVFVDRVAIG